MALVEKLASCWSPRVWRDVHVAIALSGGADSVALLRAMHELKQKEGGKGEIVALHVNHHLRGAESDEDARWCETFCRELGVSFRVLDGNVVDRAAADGDGIEAAARAERYRLVTATAEQLGARYLATAHTRDDNIETVLFRILRGTGPRGLRGIAKSRSLSSAITLVRPMIDCTRAEVIDDLGALGQDYRTDSSNVERTFTRNRIRMELLPMLRAEYSTSVDDALVRLATQAGELQQFVETQAEALLEAALAATTENGFTVNVDVLRDQSPILVREALRLAWQRVGLPEQAMTHDWWCQLAALATRSAGSAVINLPGNVRGEASENLLTVSRIVPDPGRARDEPAR